MNKSSNKKVNERISLITGDPKKAIRSLSLPVIMSMVLLMAYNLVDSIWVAGLGANALAALGFITPIFMIVIGLGTGIGAGANSLIARCIGAKNKKDADNAAIHSILITIMISAILTPLILILLPKILLIMGAGGAISLGLQYGQIVFGGIIFLIFSSVAAGVLRSEGDVKRPMYAMLATAILNIILDPIFIYYFGWGIAGAAWATIASAAISSLLLTYWLLIKRDTYISLSRKDFTPSKKIVKGILGVGLPAGSETLVMSVLGIILNGILVFTGGVDAVAVYTAGWRIVMIAMIPAIGIGTAAITVAGTAFGAKNYSNLSIAFKYSGKLGVGIALLLSGFIYVSAPYLASIFSYSAQSAFLAPSIASFLQVICLFIIAVPLGIMASSAFQGMGKGITSLILTIIRELAFICIFAYIFSIVMGLGQIGVWWGIIVGGALGCFVAYSWAWKYIKSLKENYISPESDKPGSVPGK